MAINVIRILALRYYLDYYFDDNQHTNNFVQIKRFTNVDTQERSPTNAIGLDVVLLSLLLLI